MIDVGPVFVQNVYSRAGVDRHESLSVTQQWGLAVEDTCLAGWLSFHGSLLDLRRCSWAQDAGQGTVQAS